jgi:hypothetical protein
MPVVNLDARMFAYNLAPQVFAVFEPYFKKGYDIRPTIAVTKAHIEARHSFR